MYGYNSFSKYIKCRVPQGSILGLVLFLLYISDLCNVSKALDFMLFADNTNTFYSRQDPNQLMEIVNSKLKKLPSWISIIFIQSKTKHAKTWLTFALNDIEMKFCSWELYFVNTYLAILNTEVALTKSFKISRHYKWSLCLKVIPLFCTAHPLLRITLPHPRWRWLFPLARK